MDYKRETSTCVTPLERIKSFKEFHVPAADGGTAETGRALYGLRRSVLPGRNEYYGNDSGCPLHNLVPEWNDLVYTGTGNRHTTVLKNNNFPEFTSRVCPALCEAACTCGHWGDAVTVRKTSVGLSKMPMRRDGYAAETAEVRTGKKVAVIGSGPSGLAVAQPAQ